MDYKKLVDFYVGREVSLNEYILFFSEDTGLRMDCWNIADKPQPTIAELDALQPQVDIQENNAKILDQIIELDNKRSRAFFEPSEKEAGQTWLEYYNQEITKLRNKLI